MIDPTHAHLTLALARHLIAHTTPDSIHFLGHHRFSPTHVRFQVGIPYTVTSSDPSLQGLFPPGVAHYTVDAFANGHVLWHYADTPPPG